MTTANIYGRRARIGYLCPPRMAEILPRDFYRIAPEGVTLVISTLTVTALTKIELDQAYELSMTVAREMVAAGVDVVFFGGMPINRARGQDNARGLDALEAELGVKISSSAAAQEKAAKALGCQKVVVAHPYDASQDARHSGDAQRYGCEVLGAKGFGAIMSQFGRIPREAALDLGRALMRQHPQADSILYPSPHWPVIEAIEPLEREFGVSVMTALQAFVWDALRLAGVNDRIEGYGRLLREF